MSTETPRPIRNVLAATGLTPESAGGLLLGSDLARRFGAELHVVHVVEPPSEVEERAIPGLTERYVAFAAEELGKFCASHGMGAAATQHLLRGEPEAEILRLRKQLRADVLVLGRYGKGGLKRGRLGSIAHRLVRRSQVSVLVAQPDFRGPVQRVGVACDFHEESRMELRRAMELAAKFGAGEVVVLASYEVPAGYHTIMSWEDACSRLEAALRELAEKSLALAAAEAPGARAWRLRMEEGPPTSRIPAMAQEEHLDLLVLGTHGRSRAAMALLGRTSEKIIDAAGCSVWAERDSAKFQGFVEMLRELAE
ncbi:MAG TPA: universal stress protein [Phycisphaerales bacterium]|nr:universal stress protein [Phycisphaerales bacterium]